MKAEANSGSPIQETLTPTLVERVRELAVGRQIKASPHSRDGSDLANASATTAFARLSRVSAKNAQSERVFKEKCLRDMDRGRPFKDRLAAMRATSSHELRQLSVDSLRAIWAAVEDLISVQANMEARQASLELLRRSASHPGLGPEERKALCSMILTPISPSGSRLQILALRELMHDGVNVSPCEKEVSAYLVATLKDVFIATLEARSALKKNKSRRPIIEEETLEELLRFANDLVDRSSTVLGKDNLSILIQRLIWIANKTTSHKDLEQVAFLIRTITSRSSIPPEHFESCIEVLCGISCTSDASVGEATWTSMKSLLASENQTAVVDFLLRILRYWPKDRQSITVRGALLSLKHIVEANGEDSVPIIDMQQLLYALQAVAPTNSRLQVDCLQIVISCLEDQETASRLLDSDWSSLDAVIYRTDDTMNTVNQPLWYPLLGPASLLSSFVKYYQTRAFSHLQENWTSLERLARHLESNWANQNTRQRTMTLGLMLHVGCYVDRSMLAATLDHIIGDRLLLPTNEDWIYHISILLEVIAFDTSKPLKFRYRIFALFDEIVQDTKVAATRLEGMKELVHLILKKMAKESEVPLTNILAQSLVRFALDDDDDDVFDAVLAFVAGAASFEGTTDQTAQNPVSTGAQNNRAATHLVWLFQQCLTRCCPLRTKCCFERLVAIAVDATMPTDSRLTIMKLLSRLRCNPECALAVISVPDTLGLAAALCRTEASAQMRNPSRGMLNRASGIAESPGGRIGRTSGIELSRSARSRSTTRSGNGHDRSIKATLPLWMYPGTKGLPIDPPQTYSKDVYICNGLKGHDHDHTGMAVLGIERWSDLILDILQFGSDWEIYSYVLVHLPSQLTNIALFTGRIPFVQSLHRTVLSQLRTGNFHEPPAITGVKKGDVALCLYNTMTILLAYKECLGRDQLDETVRIFYTGIGTWDRAARSCIHALVLCSHEIPANLRRFILLIIQKMSQIITQSHLAVDILEFLASLVRLPETYQIVGPESQDFLRTVFGICISYIHHAREQREKSVGATRPSHAAARHSGLSNKSSTASEASQSSDVQKDLPEYVFTIAYHVLTLWFLAIDVRERSKHVGWIVKNLTWKDELGNESMEEQSQVTLDMIHRTAYNDLGETHANVDFHDAHGPILKETWLVGMSIISLETVQETGLTLITKRQASGTTHAMYQQYTAQLPPHHVAISSANTNVSSNSSTKVFPQHILLQLGFTIAPVPIPLQPLLLPEDAFMERAISSFDRNDTVDGHKAGVIYIAPDQTSEPGVLANVSGSKVYEEFLSRLGTKVRLQDAKFNTQGLDRESDMDGSYTYAWRDRVSEIIFHVATMMPTLDHDPQCTNKKRHIGNDYVKIIFNESGLPFRFETFTSQFNHVNIIITPELTTPRHSIATDIDSSNDLTAQTKPGDTPEDEETAFFSVQTLCSPSFPQVSPTATPKVVSASALPSFVRQLALNASVLSLVWSNQREGGENLSSWRNRLKEIIKLRQRYANTGTSANVSYPGMGNPSDRGGAPSYVDGDRWTGRLVMAGMAEQEHLLYSADFTRWN